MTRILCVILLLACAVDAQRGRGRGPGGPGGPPRRIGPPGPGLRPSIVPGPIFVRKPGSRPSVPSRPILRPGLGPPGERPVGAPVPEPTTWALMASGAAILGVRRRRKLKAEAAAASSGESPEDPDSEASGLTV